MPPVFKRLSVCIVLFAALPAYADSLSPVQIMMMQVSLKEHGFYSGSPSGKVGAETIAALDKFASQYSAPSTPDEAYIFMMQKSSEASAPVSDTMVIDRVTEAIKKKAAASFIVVTDIRQIDAPGTPIICGKAAIMDDAPVSFYGLFFPKNGLFIPGGIDDAKTPPIVSLRCSLTFP